MFCLQFKYFNDTNKPKIDKPSTADLTKPDGNLELNIGKINIVFLYRFITELLVSIFFILKNMFLSLSLLMIAIFLEHYEPLAENVYLYFVLVYCFMYFWLPLFPKQFVEPLTSPQSTEYVKATAQRAATEQVSALWKSVIAVLTSSSSFSLSSSSSLSFSSSPHPRLCSYPHLHLHLHPNSLIFAFVLIVIVLSNSLYLP